MFSKQIFNRLLQLKYQSVCCKYLIINRQLIERTDAVRWSSRHVPEINRSDELTLTDKITDFANKAISSRPMRNDLKEMDVNDEELMELIGDRKIDALNDKPDNELLDEISPVLPISFNLAAFADKSETLQNFIKLGVDLNYIENRSTETAEYLLKLDFESDIKPYIRFLVDNGLKPESLGHFLSRNPFIFTQHLDDLSIRIKYLESKRFTKDMIASIITDSPKFLNFATKSVDNRLGLLQKDFQLSADEIRQLVVNYPHISLLHPIAYQEMNIIFKDEFGFNSNEIKNMIQLAPRLFHRVVAIRKGHRVAIKIFDLVHNEMKVPHQLIARHPQILNRRYSELEGLHLYLKKLGRDQYDPKQPLYVPLIAFTTLEDNEFCQKYAKTSVQDFNLFLKSI